MNTVSFPGLGLEFTLNPVAFSIGNLRITWYGLLIATGMFLAMWFAFSQCKKFGIISDRLINAVMGGVIGGIVGARLYYVAFRWDDFKDDLLSIFRTWEGGMAIYGGLIGALVVGLIVGKLSKLRLLPTLDLTGMGFLIGQSVGRWGNFVNVEAFGSNTDLPWGMTGGNVVWYLSQSENVSALEKLGVAVDASAPVHPCFLYESLWCALGFLLLFLYKNRRRFDGELFLMYLGWYGLGRFFIEGLRTDSLLIGTVRVSQLLAALLVVASTIVWIVIRLRISGRHDPEYLKPYGQTEAFAEELASYEAELQEKAERKKKKSEASSEETDETPDSETVLESEEAEDPQLSQDDGTHDDPAAAGKLMDEPKNK